jgi:AraC-like DNA-binding protein
MRGTCRNDPDRTDPGQYPLEVLAGHGILAATMGLLDLPVHAFDDDGRRRPGSWPEPASPPGLDLLLAHTPVTFVSAAQWRWEEGRVVPNRRLPTTNLALYMQGRGTAWIAGQALKAGPGVLIITPRGWAQRVAHDPGHPYQALSVHAQMPVFGGSDDLFAVLGAPCRLVMHPEADAPVTAAMAAMARLDACRPPGWADAARSHLVLLLHHLLDRHGRSFRPPRDLPTGPDAARLAPALAVIDDLLPAGPVRLPDLARAVGLGPVATRRLFLRLTGLPPNRYIQRRRIDRACRLLRAGGSLADIAAAVGCADATVLHRLFRRWTGTTPEAWRRRGAE